ncbi:FRIGIDA-like protein 3 [Cinnamomum micranthum f. kanehirae]|uniref:FRIGIDA-like protein n=1 Tax=Cinnamomum micranthum f. kanehirae TaxID=337451 RepID=A0A3S3NK39_9MAGN|nr:FRIGIDA-like protein 3 [Cinnamomum micranthum f. kanehirae]
MADAQSVATLIDTTTSKIQQLQQAFAELESHRAISLNLKWKELEAHFHGLERSLKRRFSELENQEKEFETRASEAREMLAKRESVVVAKEQASLARLQEKRDDALAAIGDVFGKYKMAKAEPFVNGTSNGPADAILEEKLDVKVAEPNSGDVKPAEDTIVELKPCPELTKLCEEMDAKGLHKFISDNRKNLASLREEIPFALKSSRDPGCLVLDSLEDFYCVEMPLLDGKMESSLLGVRRTCIMLMESLMSLLTGIESNSAADKPVISSDIKGRAKAIANEWKPKLDNLDTDASNGNSLEAHAFLQLLATFDLVSEFDQDEVCKLIPMVSRRRKTAELCRSLGLTEKLPSVVEVLVNSGRQLEAFNLVYAFELTEQFDPVSLLKAYLEARKVQNDANERELCALKVVIKSIEEHKLEEQYPLDPLQKQVVQLEKVKADKRRAAEAAKPQSKRPRANVAGYGPRITNIPDKCVYRAPERYPYMYDRPYLYATDNHGPSLVGSASYNLSHNHGSYYGNGYQYPAPYLH